MTVIANFNGKLLLFSSSDSSRSAELAAEEAISIHRFNFKIHTRTNYVSIHALMFDHVYSQTKMISFGRRTSLGSLSLDCEQSLFCSKICEREYLSSEVVRVAKARIFCLSQKRDYSPSSRSYKRS